MCLLNWSHAHSDLPLIKPEPLACSLLTGYLSTRWWNHCCALFLGTAIPKMHWLWYASSFPTTSVSFRASALLLVRAIGWLFIISINVLFLLANVHSYCFDDPNYFYWSVVAVCLGKVRPAWVLDFPCCRHWFRNEYLTMYEKWCLLMKNLRRNLLPCSGLYNQGAKSEITAVINGMIKKKLLLVFLGCAYRLQVEFSF